MTRAVGVEGGAPGVTPRDLEAPAREIESAVLALEEGRGEAPASQVLEAQGLAPRLRGLLRASAGLADEPLPDPFGFIEDDISWVERSARELRDSGGGLRASAERVLERARDIRAGLARRRIARLSSGEARPAGEGPLERASGAWLEAAQCFRIEAGIARSVDGAGPLPVPEGDLAALRARREAALLECAAALKECGPAQAGRFVRSASADLADHSSAVLSETASASPAERVPALKSLRERIEALQAVLAASGRGTSGKGAPSGEDAAEVRRRLRLLEKERRRSVAAEREALVRVRLESTFGRRRVWAFEMLLLAVIAAFLVLLIIEWRLPEDSPWIPAIHALDIAFCSVFQLDFFVRWGFSRWSGRYFLRHFFLESLPALPYGFFLHHLSRVGHLGAFEQLRAVILARILGLRSVILLVVRVGRLFAFLVQGSDRAAEKFRWVLDRDVAVFEALPAPDAPEPPLRARLRGLEARRERLARGIFLEVPPAERPAILERQLLLLDEECRAAADVPRRLEALAGAPRGEIHLERLIERLLEWDEARVIELLGPEGTRRAARWLRIFDVPLIRKGPFVRRLIPAARIQDPAEAVAAAGQALGEMLENFLGAVRFWGDLSGITTGPQILDRLATAMIAAARRPAFRLIFFGGLFLILEGLAEVLRLEALEELSRKLVNVLGLPLLILGSICLGFFHLGRWFRRIAGEALDIYQRTADAHFYSLLKVWKIARRESDARYLYRSVLLCEEKLREPPWISEEDWVAHIDGRLGAGGEPSRWGRREAALSEEAESIALLYRDFLDGPILNRLDDKTSVQLLGNLVIQDIRLRTLRLGRREIRRLETLDLEKDRLLGFGPYFWFRFITESLAIETSKLVMEYKTSCIPRDQLHLAGPEARARFRAFLGAREEIWNAGVERLGSKALHSIGKPVLTDEFDAIDFLVVRPERDEVIRERFGDDVLAALRRDRRGMVRDIFGTHPYHLLPREERVLNPYVLYRRYLGGARFLFLPLFAALGALRIGARALAQAIGLVREVLGRESARPTHLQRTAGFDVAVRKINRMRKPFFMEALKLRAAVDIEYLGLRLPGFERDEGAPSYREDLEFIGARGVERRPIETSRASAVRELRRFRSFLAGRGWLKSGLDDLIALLDPSGQLGRRKGEVIRALVTAFITDQEGLRSSLLAGEEARELVEKFLARKETLSNVILGSVLRFTRRGRRRRDLLDALLAGESPPCSESHPLVGDSPPCSPPEGAAPRGRPEGAEGSPASLTAARRRKALRAFVRGPASAERLVERALERARAGDGGDALLLAELRSAGESHAIWTRRILTARALQAITVLDIRSYREMVRVAGEYGPLDPERVGR